MLSEETIAAEAIRLGFAAVGFARAAPSESTELFHDWLRSGRSAGMTYLARHADLRSDPRQLAPGTTSVIVTAARYPVTRAPGAGFASYAHGRDYHAVMKEKLEELAAFIRSRTSLAVARVCVDSAPVPEREWATRAGLGWRGKQGQIVNPIFGCCFVLGLLLVDIDLACSVPATNQCGSCDLCIKACPTGAIDDNGAVDANRCISYLTTEHNGDIPEKLHPVIGGALFGCDICTSICPWNRHEDNMIMPELAAGAMPDAETCLAMSEADFNKQFSDSTVSRLGLKRLQRNAAIALANQKSSPQSHGKISP
jgi:epoxyqueuosine reductase